MKTINYLNSKTERYLEENHLWDTVKARMAGAASGATLGALAGAGYDGLMNDFDVDFGSSEDPNPYIARGAGIGAALGALGSYPYSMYNLVKDEFKTDPSKIKKDGKGNSTFEKPSMKMLTMGYLPAISGGAFAGLELEHLLGDGEISPVENVVAGGTGAAVGLSMAHGARALAQKDAIQEYKEKLEKLSRPVLPGEETQEKIEAKINQFVPAMAVSKTQK